MTLGADYIELTHLVFAYEAFFHFGYGDLLIMKFITVQSYFKLAVEKFKNVGI